MAGTIYGYVRVSTHEQNEARRQRQAEGIAAAKAKGVRFGREPKPVPENFAEVHRAWRKGQMSLQKAAAACGMARGTFYSAALRKEQAEENQAG